MAGGEDWRWIGQARPAAAAAEAARQVTLESGEPASSRERPPLLVVNLLNDLDTLGPLLVERVAAGDLLNAFLIAAGMRQIGEDYLHRDPLLLGRVGGRLRRRVPSPWGDVGAAAARGIAWALWTGLVSRPEDRIAARWVADVANFSRLVAATLVATSAWELRCAKAELEAEARELAGRLVKLPIELRRELIRMPSCFRSFDQAPEDLQALAAAFAARWTERSRPLLAVGIRSSGGYLAPLVAAFLRREGYSSVQDLTLRPDQRWFRAEARLIRAAARAGTVALLIDDPPRTWESVLRAARNLAALGFEPERVVLLLGTFPDAGHQPPTLAQHPAVLLPFEHWAIARRLQPQGVSASLGILLNDRGALTELRLHSSESQSGVRGHAHAVYEVAVRQGQTVSKLLIRARGVGLGYLGEHALAVANRLPEFVPTVYGLDRGILYEEWLPATRRLAEPLTDTDIADVAAYGAARTEAMPLPEDPAGRLPYRGAAWHWAGGVFGGLFGRGAEAGRIVGMRVARGLLVPNTSALIDNHAQISAFARKDHRIVKTDFDAGVFTSDDFYCFDPIADVALAAVSADEADTGTRLRRAYEKATGKPVDAERWLLYQLAHIVASQSHLPPLGRHTDRRPDRRLQRYYAEVLLAEAGQATTGPLCGIDVDGVLETMSMGFPATSPKGAMSLRALRRHGFRPVLLTGRSLSEVRDRCLAYGIAGGVAEYGAVIFDCATGESEVLIDSAARGALRDLRETLAAMPGVLIDPAYEQVVRAFRVDVRDRRRGLSQAAIDEALVRSGIGHAARVVPGFFQTDFVAAATRKETGLRHLARRLDVHREPPLALGIGDTWEDIGILREARLGVAPANADRSLRQAGVTVLRRPAQAGLAEAIAQLIGHPPGRCPICAPPPLSPSSRRLLALLGVEDAGRWGRLISAVRLW